MTPFADHISLLYICMWLVFFMAVYEYLVDLLLSNIVSVRTLPWYTLCHECDFRKMYRYDVIKGILLRVSLDVFFNTRQLNLAR